MAFTYNTLQSIVQDYLAPRVVDNTSKGCPYFYFLRENGRLSIRGGEQISFPLIKAHLANEWYSGLDSATLEQREPATRARYPWALGRVPFVIAEDDIDKAGGDTNVVDLVDLTEQDASLTMIEMLSTGLFGTNASASKQILGLQDMGAASGTAYGGLTDTDFVSPATWIMNIYTLLTANTLTAQDMRRMRGNVTRGNARPNLGLTNFSVYAKIWNIAQNVQRFGMERIAKLGFDHIMFEDMPIMPDEHSPGSGYGSNDNWLFFLNIDFIKLVLHEAKAFTSRVYQPIPQIEAHIGKIYFMGQQLTTQRRAHSVNKVINPTN